MNELRDVLGNAVQARDINSVHFTKPVHTALNGVEPPTPTFIGRTEQLAELGKHRFVVVSGLAGVGKTELVRSFAQQHDFPGGRLAWDFQGYDPVRRTGPEQAADSFLSKLGIEERPRAEADRAAFFRSLVADREPMLILLDNVSTAAQARPLLVHGQHHMIVTSRHLLTGLSGAHVMQLEVLPQSDAAQVAGDAEIADLCGGLPLALQIMAALRRIDQDNDWAAELREARLTLLHHDDQNVRAAFDLSYECLSEQERRLFRLLALHPGDVITLEGAVALTGQTESVVKKLMRSLHTANLLEQGPRFHDLVRDYALEQAQEDPGEMVPAIGRCAVEFISRAENAELDWIGERFATLAATVAVLHIFRAHALALRLALTMAEFLNAPEHSSIWLNVGRTAVSSARVLNDQPAEVRVRTRLGLVHLSLDQLEEAQKQLGWAAHIAAQSNDFMLFAHAVLGCTELQLRTGEHKAAIRNLRNLIATAVKPRELEMVPALTDSLERALAHRRLR